MKAAAVVTVRDADKMTPAGRRRVADWLRYQARLLVKHGDQFSRRFTGRYLYRTVKGS